MGDTAVAVVEGVDGHEPQVSDGGLDDRVRRRVCVEPVQEGVHLSIEATKGRRFIMDPFAPARAGHDLHRPRRLGPPGTDDNAGHAAAARRKEGRVPVEQALLGQGLR